MSILCLSSRQTAFHSRPQLPAFSCAFGSGEGMGLGSDEHRVVEIVESRSNLLVKQILRKSNSEPRPVSEEKQVNFT